ncbi:hypothetical protein [Eoetvoesiella caeni]|uniref:Tail spike TSP1/Gp66 N-terminal domain-containing protein n=1 Tax=Eoetvoesiella caeni TaxID=645616 RepID=A0A366HAB3_9BURK|nr:hypothetical protein [Eoetvoesiella caeni]MCI2809399.1 hypothetical protein [Eoetvoesiella caeni]NYT54540.1 hypothetical protein [Eoetvoesiella caeni]RBP39270.1 hypothetical protein DFR37_10561 [Eoetvoesiella caeni]
MTTYNTENPIGSTEVKDLYDNAQNLDIATNDRTARAWIDRLGKNRRTMWGMEEDFQDFLVNSGYENIGDYAAGLEITARNQIFWKDGELYRAGKVLDLPYTTTGEWVDEEGLFVAVGDAALRQQLADKIDPGSGAAMVGYGAGTVKDALDSNAASIAENAGAIDSNALAVDAINTRLKPGLLTPRAKPSSFDYVPGNIWECVTAGQAKHDIDLEQEFRTAYGSIMGAEAGPTGLTDKWVDPVNGVDSAEGGDLAHPYKTLKHAYQSTVGTVWLMPGRYTELFDLRCSDRTLGDGSARAVMVKAWEGPGTVTFVTSGQQPAEMTWADQGNQVWSATPADGKVVELIIFHDEGKEIPIHYKGGITPLVNTGYGWYQNMDDNVVYLAFAGRSINADKAKFEIIYVGAGGTLFGPKVYLHGITFRGIDQIKAYYENSNRPVIYAKDCTFEYGGYSNVTTQGAIFFSQNCVSRRALVNDGFNYYDSVAGSPYASTPGGVVTQALEIGNICIENGVVECKGFQAFPENQTRNKQGSSGHENSIIARINGLYENNYGQNIADTGAGSRTWMVGSKCGNPFGQIGGGAALGGFPSLWTEGAVWLDTVTAGGRLSTEGLHVETGICHTYRCGFSGTTADTVVGGTATLSSYDALAPEI